MNDTLLNANFTALTVGQLLALANSDNLDDKQLARRLARRIVIEERSIALGDVVDADLETLREVTDRDLNYLAAQKGSR